jgi:hypothetical protein
MNGRARIILPEPIQFLPGLPNGLRRQDAPDYILSRTYGRVMGDNLPRREVLLKLAASLAAVAAPLQPARAMPLIPVAITLVAIGAEIINVFKNTFGSFDANNDEARQKTGYIMLTVFHSDSNTSEGSITAQYSFPANTTVTINFNSGPAATTPGMKTLEVSAEDDSGTDKFEAV